MKIIDRNNGKALFSEDYNFIFKKNDGFFMRWGKTKEDDPQFSPYGPEILDLEISSGKCNGRTLPKHTNRFNLNLRIHYIQEYIQY